MNQHGNLISKFRERMKNIFLCYRMYYFLAACKFYVANNFIAHIPVEILRNFYYRYILRVRIGHSTHLSMRLFFTGYHNHCDVAVGNNCVINREVYLDGRVGVYVGNNVNISFGTSLLSLHHDHNDPNFISIGAPIEINDHVWIGAHSIILPGVTLGEGSVVAAGAVVTRSVPAYKVVGGVPAKVIGERNRNIQYKTHFSPFFDTDIYDESAN